MLPEAHQKHEGLITCRAGLEQIVAQELKSLDVKVVKVGKRAVFFETDLAGIYRANMGLHSAISVLLPLRTFNARNYDMLYYQSRKTNWHKLFEVDRTVRIDVNGGSDVLTHSAYVVHRVKDGIVDTFRKLTDGKRPSIDKGAPDVHVVVHLEGTRVTLCLDTSGIPLFKRGYRTDHGAAPIKEDLAAGIVQLCGWDRTSPLLDPLCGSGTLLFEAWLLASRTAPNLHRGFAFQHISGYDPALHQQEQMALAARICPPPGMKLYGIDSDPHMVNLTHRIWQEHFPTAPIVLQTGKFQDKIKQVPPAALISNPPYGERLGDAGLMPGLYADLGKLFRSPKLLAGSGLFTAYAEARAALACKPVKEFTLFNGALEGRLMLFQPHQSK